MAQNESLVLDGLALNDGTTLTLEALTMAPPSKRPEWISGADSDGAVLFRDPLHENRVIEMRLRIEQQATMNLALAKIALVVDKLEECERNDNGLALVWTPADATLAAITFRCLSGEITDMPIMVDGDGAGWFVKAPVLAVRLTCLPFGEGTETLLGSTTSTEPLVALEVSGVAGDVSALGRLVVTDAAAQSRRWIAWGLESRWYPTSSPPSLIVDSASMVTTGYAGTTATRSGAYGGGSNNVIQATLTTRPQAICGLGNLSHVGDFRPQLRFHASATTIVVRLLYQALDGPFRGLSYTVPVAVGWNHVDLGHITVPLATLGAQRWTGQIEAYSTATGGETFGVDVMELIPAASFARARAAYAYRSQAEVARDDFTGRAAGTALNVTAAPTGGTWATSGAATVRSSGVTLLEHTMSHAASLATGGALATGKPGIVDYNPSAGVNTRYYDNFYTAAPAPEPIVCYAGRSIEFRHDGTLRADASGTYAGPPQAAIGARFTVPCAGGPGRKARVAVVARRNDIEAAPDDNISDSTTVAVYATPRYLVVPR